MRNLERDKFLSELIGDCWCEIDRSSNTPSVCIKCGATTRWADDLCLEWTNFSEPTNFFRLWNFIKTQHWASGFIWNSISHASLTSIDNFIQPDSFADKVYVYIKQNELYIHKLIDKSEDSIRNNYYSNFNPDDWYETKIQWVEDRWRCIYCGKSRLIKYIATGHDHTDYNYDVCNCEGAKQKGKPWRELD